MKNKEMTGEVQAAQGDFTLVRLATKILSATNTIEVNNVVLPNIKVSISPKTKIPNPSTTNVPAAVSPGIDSEIVVGRLRDRSRLVGTWRAAGCFAFDDL
jgi:hypothetical protein